VKQQRQRRKEEQVLPVEARELAGPKREWKMVVRERRSHPLAKFKSYIRTPAG
jgi:hypothetical protein